jgi:hypothetical protein
MVKTKLKREQRGAVNVNPILIVALVGIAAVVGAAWYEKWGPFGKGDVSVSLGYILADGTEVPLEGNATHMLYVDPLTFALYTDSSKTTAVAGVYAVLSVKPVTDIENTGQIAVNWTRKVYAKVITESRQSVFDATGTQNMTPNVDAQISASKCLVTSSTFVGFGFSQSATWVFRFTYDVSASVQVPSADGGYSYVTASVSTEGQISVYYNAGTLSLVASTTKGYLNLVK